MTKTLKRATTLLALALPIQAAAIELLPGSVIFPTGTTFSDTNSGLIINDDLINFRMDPTPLTPITDVGGSLQNRVLRNSLDELVFMPRIRNTFNIDGGTFGITGLRLEGYGDIAMDADFRTDGLGDKGPTSISRSNDGDILTMRYQNPILVDAVAPGLQETSYFPSIVTNATEFETTGTMTVYGQLFALDFGAPPTPISDLVSVTLGGLAVPSAAIPLPAPILMLGAGLAGLLGLRRRA